MLTVHNFTYGLITPVVSYVMSCMGAFIGLRCTTRAYAYQGRARVRWLAAAAIAIGTTGIWVMHFIAMLGYTIPGMTIHYNVPITIVSMLIAVVVVFAGLLIVGFGRPGWRNLLLAGLITGIGVASMHYVGMAAMEMKASESYKPSLFALSIVIAVVAATAALWAALRLRGYWHTVIAALIMGVAVSGMHYTGMAALLVHSADGRTVSVAAPTAAGFLLPLIIGIGVVALVFAGVLAFSPTNEEIREDAALMARINAATARLEGTAPVPAAPATVTARWPGNAGRGGAHGQNPPRNGTPAGYGGQAQNGGGQNGGGQYNGAASPNGAAYPSGAGNASHPNGAGNPAGSGHRRLPRRAAPPADNGPRSLPVARPARCCREPGRRPEWARARQRSRNRFRAGCPGLAAPHLPGAIRADQAAGDRVAPDQEHGGHLPPELGGGAAGQRDRGAGAAQAAQRDPGHGGQCRPAQLLRAGRRARG
jgi:NO-binding membrane sensor protein with MHYT domain